MRTNKLTQTIEALHKVISEHKKTEEKLRSSYEYLDTILLNMPAGVAILEGPEFRYFRINKALAEINGLSVEDHLGRPLAEVLPDAAPDLLPRMREVFESGEPALQHEFNTRLPKDPDQIRWFIDFFFPIKSVDGKPMAIGAVVLDITERKQAEELMHQAMQDLNLANQDLEQKVRARTAKLEQEITERKQAEADIRQLRDEFAHIARVSAMGELTAYLAHELKQPLTAIRINAQAAQRFLTGDKPNIDELHEALKDIIKDNRRADDVIEKLRAMLRKSQRRITRLQINNIVRDTLPLINSYGIMRNISFKLELDENIQLVAGDRIQLQQVILNLILNSSEALMDTAEELRTIVVRTSQEDTQKVTLSVKDNGPGIEEKVVSHLFEPFYTTKQEGLGIGLTISRFIIEEHAGQLWAENNPDSGTTFYFTVPIAKGNSA